MTKPALPRANRNGCIFALAIIIGLGLLAIFACVYFANPRGHPIGEKEKEEQRQIADRLKALETSSPSQLRPDGVLKVQFQKMSEFGNSARNETERQIKGNIVEWTLTVFQVSHQGSEYRIQTSDTDKVETLVVIDAAARQERSRIDALRTGDVITVRGYIKGITMGSVEISPALLVR